MGHGVCRVLAQAATFRPAGGSLEHSPSGTERRRWAETVKIKPKSRAHLGSLDRSGQFDERGVVVGLRALPRVVERLMKPDLKTRLAVKNKINIRIASSKQHRMAWAPRKPWSTRRVWSYGWATVCSCRHHLSGNDSRQGHFRGFLLRNT